MGAKAFVFDMDGTLLHSLPDLARAVNEALAQMGFPEREYDEILAFMGTGSARLIDCAVPASAGAEERERTFDLWRSLYLASDYAGTAPFPGITDTLRELRARGTKTAILSNKFDAGVRALAERDFPGLFDAVRGEIPPAPRKPDPTTLLQMLDELEVRPEDAVYVGDARVDLQTARNAGVRFAGVSWGYDAAAPLPLAELDAYIRDPRELLEL